MSDSANRPLIMLADDDVEIRRLLSRTLSSLDVEIIEAQDGEEALEMLIQHNPTLVVLDVMMPGINGLEFTERIRKAQNAVPILLLTARAEVEQRIEGLAMGADDYLPKPFDPKELLLRIQNILRRSIT